jgi:regulation of enolase protein 1 (concanavalin A-like superfamily)
VTIRGLHGGVVRITLASIVASAFVTQANGQSLPAGWAARDIGTPAVAGSTEHSSGTFTLKGAGDVAGTIDTFQFAYRQITGDATIQARVVSIERVQRLSKAGVMIRESLSADAAMGMVFASGASRTGFYKRLTAGASRTSTNGARASAPYWVRLQRHGTQLTASQSSNGVTWTTIGTMTLAAPTIYVGLAVASADANRLATGVIDNVVITPPVANQTPAVTLTGPVDGATFIAPATISLNATASDTDGTISTVEFYAGTTLIGSDTTSPYTATWSNVAAGSYSLTAIARDNVGAAGTSSAHIVTVSGSSTNQPPAISLTSPASGATFTAPASIALAAAASDTDGTIARVDFYAGTTLVGSDTSSPYSYTWSGVAAGSYSLTAVARDNGGAATTSAARSVTVSPGSSNQAPVISLTAPAAGAIYTAPASVTVAATASDTDGSVTRVDFYAGSVLIGSDTTSPYSITWINVAAGSYSLTAVARDNAGAVTVSGARDIRVDPATLPRTAIFTASTDHATAVDRYFLEIFPAGSDPLVANPVATRDLGKPAVVSGQCTVDVSSTTVALPAGSYVATVTAIGSGGSSRSAASPTFVR